MKKVFLLSMVLVTCLAAIPRSSDARWGGVDGRNMARDAKNLPAEVAATKPLWELNVGTRQYAIPTIDRGRIYIGTNDMAVDRPRLKRTGGGRLLCVDQATGKTIWSFISPRFMGGLKAPYHYNHWKCGICSGPVVEDDRVYIVGSRGEILCLDRAGQANGNAGPFVDELAYMGVAPDGPGAELVPTDGDLVWRYDMLKELDVVPHDVCGSTLLLHGDLIFANTSNGIGPKHKIVPHPQAPSLIVLNKKTGKLIATDGEKIGERMLHGHWSSPSLGRVDDRPLVFFGGGDGVLYAFEVPVPDPSGKATTLKKAWSHDCNPPDYRARDGKPLAYSSHSKRTPEGPSEIIASPVFHQGRVYVAIGQSPVHGEGNGLLSCVDAKTGREVWSSRLVKRSLSTVSIADGLLYISDYSGNLHCFDADSGERYWVHAMGAGSWSGSTFVADGKVYASTETNIFWTLAAGKEKKVLSKTRMRTMPATPTAVNGVLYVTTQKRLIAYPGGAK